MSQPTAVPVYLPVLDPALTGQPPYPTAAPYLPALTAQTLMTADSSSSSSGLEERSAKRQKLSPGDQSQGLGEQHSSGMSPIPVVPGPLPSQQDEAGGLLPSQENGGQGANHYAGTSPGGVPRLPPIMQVEKQTVTTTATQAASASRRRNEATFVCPVPNCGSTFTRRFNLRGHLRSHTEERPYVCDWPGCNKGFARQHDCKRHQALHQSKSQSNVCAGCKKTFSRLDALNRHLKSEGAADCRRAKEGMAGDQQQQQQQTINLPPPHLLQPEHSSLHLAPSPANFPDSILVNVPQ